MDQEEIELRAGDRIICRDEQDADRHEKIFKAAGIETHRDYEFGKPVLTVIGEKNERG